MSMVGFPLLLIPLAIYNIIVFLMPGVGFGETLFQLQLVSGEIWTISLGDILLALGVLLLLLEVIKAARPGGRYLTDHLLSLLVLGAAGAEFVMWPKFANSTYFLLCLLAMVDFFSGIALRSKRRNRIAAAAPVSEPPVAQEVEAAPASEAAAEPEPARPVVVEAPPPEPAIVMAGVPAPQPASEPAPIVEPGPIADPAPPRATVPAPDPEPAEPLPAAASVAESVLLDHPDPRPAPAVAAADEPKAPVEVAAEPPKSQESPKA